MMDITFERFLEKKFEAGYNGLDDDMPDAMDTWFCLLDADDINKYANEYGKFMYAQGMIACHNNAVKTIREA